MTRRLLLLPILLFVTSLRADEREITFSETTAIRLATKEEGKELIARKDDFVAALSKFDLQSRLKTGADVKADDLLKLYQENVTDWPDEDAKAVLEAFAFVADRLKECKLKLPPKVFIIRTTGQEEAGAAYCRGPAIVLPAGKTGTKSAGLRQLCAHELFHVISSHDVELRTALYRMIGFTTCDPIVPPAKLRDRTIANPDAPRSDCVIELELDGERVFAAPILLASADFDPAANKSLFGYLQARLMVVEKQGDGWRAIENDGEPRLLEPSKLDSFWKQIGRNTNYIIHPDEILADNFMHLVMGTKDLKSPEVVEKMRETLKKQVTPSRAAGDIGR
jgi:hypothetical protein